MPPDRFLWEYVVPRGPWLPPYIEKITYESDQQFYGFRVSKNVLVQHFLVQDQVLGETLIYNNMIK
jgi:hypothetical protein